MQNKALQFLTKLFMVCYAAAMLLVFLSNTNEVSVLQIELLVLVLALVLLFRKRIPHFAILLFAFSFAVRLGVCLFYNTVPVSDFKTMYEAAQQTIRGDFTWNSDIYFSDWAYQTGFVLFEALFLKIFNSIWTLKIVNCLLGAGIAVLIYQISLLLWKDEGVAQIVSGIYSVFAFHAAHVTVLTNSHASAFFSFCGIWFLLRSTEKTGGGVKWQILSGVFIAVGNILRPEGICFLTPIIVLYLFRTLACCDKASVVRCIKQLGALLIAYFLVVNAASGLIKMTGVNANGLSNQNPLWKFVLGFNYESGGTWNDGDSEVVAQRTREYGGDKNAAEWSIIKERMDSSRRLTDLAFSKMDTFWWDPGAVNWTVDGIYPRLYEMSRTIHVSEFWVMFCFSAIGLFYVKENFSYRMELLLTPFLIFVNFFVYLLIEVQTRYAYLSQIAVFLLAGGGMLFVKEKWLHWREEMQPMRQSNE